MRACTNDGVRADGYACMAGEPSRSQGSESDLSCSSEAEERYETCSSGGASDAPESRHESRHKTSVSCGGSGDCAGSGGLKYRSVISDVFDGKLLSSVQCLICDRVSTRVETFQDLSLPIPSREQLAVLRSQQPILNQHAPGQAGHESWLWWFLSWLRSWFYGPVVSLQDCLAAFFSADELKGDNMYSCSRCNKLRNGVKMSGVVRLPEVLCVHLKRFRHELMFSAKVGARVAFPLQDLNMAPYTHKDCTSKITRYELSAVISHSGTAGGGHYTCVAKNGPNWYEFDDQCVTPISATSVAHIEAYVLFYRKVNPQMAVLRQKAMEILESATYEPNDIKFFISKQWLNKFNTWAEPGPIDNSDFVCAHGAVRPDRAPHLHELAQRVPQHYWDFMYANFGGGPACTHVHECSGCARAAERLRERRATELRAFYELHAMFQAQEHPRAVYAISMNWFRQWQAFVRDKTPRPPPPVDNTGIVSKQEQESGTMYALKPGSDHAQLSEELWRFFTGIYGGGPEVLLRRAPAVHTPRYSHSRTSDSDREDHVRSASETNLRPSTENLQKNQTLQNVFNKYNDKEEERYNTREQNGNYQDSEEEDIKENGIDSSDHDANDNIVYRVRSADVELQNADGVSLKNKKLGRVRKMKRRTVK
ncbi:Ubiquitin carboxyl-terminal hydrolase 20 [Eumeta japonica]|uniref:ubiquitinyl hydrolase 1 n=1 Tax=Eumeta variegata TaxID=151549 RepID=A0A4C1WA73_EUMVA|nr:Ubiquitin carboxyl-terminal hydrolase 20 [Eumeta japonica]